MVDVGVGGRWAHKVVVAVVVLLTSSRSSASEAPVVDAGKQAATSTLTPYLLHSHVNVNMIT